MGQARHAEDPGRAAAARTAWAIAPGVFLAGVGGGIVFPILPLAGLATGLAPALVGVILAANRLTRVLSNPFVGHLVDRFGGKRLVVAGLVVETLVMGLYWWGLSSRAVAVLFLLGRALWGPASAGIFIGGQTLALQAGGREHRGLTAGIVRAAQSLGTPSGMVLGGLAAQWLGEADAFLVGAAASLVAALVALVRLPDHRATRAGHARRFRDLFASLQDRRVDALALLNFTGFFAVQGLLLATLELVIQARRVHWAHLAPSALAGLLMAALLAAGAVAMGFAARLSDRVPSRAGVSTAGLVLLVPGFALLAGSDRMPLLVASLVLIGLGMGILNGPLLALLGDVVPTRRGEAVGCVQLFGDMGGTLGPVVGTTAVAAFGARDPYWATAVLSLAAVPLGVWLVATERRTLVRSAVGPPPAAP
ncbi:MAG: MFS transporter [Actinomycetia bacterium]|nr:MFS transporter [Actinomycetes bacterium]